MDNEPKKPAKKVTILGVGRGAMHIMNYMAENTPENSNLNLICINTDKQLLECTKTKILQIGESVTNNLGCGGDVIKGEEAASSSMKSIMNEIKNTDILFIISCFGGGTGTGASLYIAKLATNLGIKTIAFITMPFSFEGKRRTLQAINGLEEMKKYAEVHNYNNDSILEHIERKCSLKDAFRIVDVQIAKNIFNLIEEYNFN